MASASAHNCYTHQVNADMGWSPKLLVVGGTSSLAPEIYKLASRSGYEIFATHRRLSNPSYEQAIRWGYLNLDSMSSIDNFFSELGDLTFSRVIFLAGATCGNVGERISVEVLSEYLKVHLIHPINLIGRLIHFLDPNYPSNLIYMSSRAANFGSADWPYGVAKAGIQNYVSSLSRSLNPPASILSVVSGLINGSRMQNDMKFNIVQSHINRANRAGGRLLTVEEIALELWGLNPDSTSNISGKVKSLGPVY